MTRSSQNTPDALTLDRTASQRPWRSEQILGRRSLLALLLLATLASTVGCGVLFDGSMDPVEFDSEPQGANVYVDGMLVGVTPCRVNVSVTVEHHVVVEAPNGRRFEGMLHRSLNAAWLILDILFGGIIAIIVDAVTGEWHNLHPNPYVVHLGDGADHFGGRDPIQAEPDRGRSGLREWGN